MPDPKVGVGTDAWIHAFHWDGGAEVTLDAIATDEPCGAAVATGRTRRIREITVRNAGVANAVLTLKVADAGGVIGATLLTLDIAVAQTRVWFSEDGRKLTAGQTAAFQSSTVGPIYVSAAGIEQ